MSTHFEAIVRRPGKPDRHVTLVPGIMLLGRSEKCDVPLPDLGVSREHARLHIRPDRVMLEDLNSANGTFIGSSRVRGTVPFMPGDRISIEPFEVELRALTTGMTPPTPEMRRKARARVDVISGPSLAQGSYLITDDGLSIGRSELRDLVILDPAASRHHCDIKLEGGQWRLVDPGSSNGVHLNDERVLDARLTHGDVIRIGNSELRFVELSPEHAEPSSPVRRPSQDSTQELSLPLPDSSEVTPPAADDAPRPAEPRSYGHDAPPWADTETQTDALRQPILPWLPVSIGFIGIALLTLTATVVLGLGILLLQPRPAAVPLPPELATAPPTWSVPLPSGAASATVPELFDSGVQHLKARRAGPALQAFYGMLTQDPGNQVAQRLSYAAGEYVLVDALEKHMRASIDERTTRDAERDALLGEYPRRQAATSLYERFRDDPVVLARTGWSPSEAEREIATRIDEAYRLAHEGRWPEAQSGFTEALRDTNNPVLKERARVGRDAARWQLARQSATAWRAGVVAERNGDLTAAQQSYRQALERVPTHASARIRLERLTGQRP